MDPWWEWVDSKRLSHAYIGHVWQYNFKGLHCDQGALAAFRGIIAAGVVDTVWGLPLRNEILIWQGYKSLRKANRNLAVALAWTSDVGYSGMEFREIRRRKGFPTWSWLSLVARIALSHHDMHNGTDDLHYCSQFDIEVSANEWKPVKDVLQELQPGSRMVETQAYGLRIYGPWFSAAVTNIQAAFTIICDDQNSKARAGDARVAKIWADEPHLVTTEFLENHSTMIFLFDSGPVHSDSAHANNHGSKWVLVVARTRPYRRLGIVRTNFCLYNCSPAPSPAFAGACFASWAPGCLPKSRV